MGPDIQEYVYGSAPESVLITNENQPSYLIDHDNNGSVEGYIPILQTLEVYPTIDPNTIPIDTNDDGVIDSNLGEVIN